MPPNGIRDSPLRTTKTRKDRTRQASAIRSELLMTSLLKGALKTETEISFYLPRSVLTGLSSSKGVPYDPIWRHLPSPARTAPPPFVFRLRLPIPCVPPSPTPSNNNLHYLWWEVRRFRRHHGGACGCVLYSLVRGDLLQGDTHIHIH